MAFDQTTRNRLARFVGEARALLTEEFTRQLQHEYGLDPASGAVIDLERMTALDDARWETARILRETMDYYLGGVQVNAKTRQDVLDRIVREQAFTVLNRLCALRMAERRGLLIESVGRGYQSKGFQLYARLAGPSLGETGEAYRSYLFSIFDEFSVDLPVLFDRFSPQGRLFPREATLLKLLDLVNDPEIEPLWNEDETIGWIYQNFNSKEERQAMRAESSAPRNSRELAVRNQFFTPRYVVEFLTDNTLGRIWYEMTKGETQLKETCRYLVRRPKELFLDKGQEEPKQDQVEENLTQEELLKQPVYIPHRPMKDPREIKMLDPACGSMHFGLYAFDLFEQIYSEAWELEEELGADALWHYDDLDSLHDTYPDKETFLQEVPRLIIERNIHGIDIDPRAVQIAGLSLWLRAQKSWQVLGLKPRERPTIRKSNIVCAEPMPGDRGMLEEFLTELRAEKLEGLMRPTLNLSVGQKVRATPQMAEALAKLVRTVWQEMELAGEAGSLLKIEETLRQAIATARKESEQKAPLFRVLEYGMEAGAQGETGGDFWAQAEALVLAALQEYTEQAANGNSFRRHLFAGDAAQGFAYIELFRKLYDVVLMNPPFGDPTLRTKSSLVQTYLDYGNDIFTFFVARGASLLNLDGRLGAITNRTGFFTVSQELWRKKVSLDDYKLEMLVDLGYGVLDALVETASYVITNSTKVKLGNFFRATSLADKETAIIGWSKNWCAGEFDNNGFIQALEDFKFLPSNRIAFWMPHSIISLFRRVSRYSPERGDVQVGLQTSDNNRFIRLAWEIHPSTIEHRAEETLKHERCWVYYAKGGEYAPYYADIHLVVNWGMNGKEVKNFSDAVGNIISYPRNERHYFQPGLTYSERTTSNLSVRVLPAGCCFDTVGPRISNNDALRNNLVDLAILMTRPIAYLIEFMVGSADVVFSGSAARHYTPRSITELPFPNIPDPDTSKLLVISKKIWLNYRQAATKCETDRFFLIPSLILYREKSLRDCFLEWQCVVENNVLEILDSSLLAEDITSHLFGLEEDAMISIRTDFGYHPCEYPNRKIDPVKMENIYTKNVDAIVDTSVNEIGITRTLTKKSYYADRRLELISHLFQAHPKSIVKTRQANCIIDDTGFREEVGYLLSYAVGIVLGRWNLCLAARTESPPELPDPFAPLPTCPPGMLKNAQGLPAAPQDIPADYPLRITWSGILVDDESHSEDIEARVREAMHVFWQSRAEAIEQEACQILGVRSLGEYFRKPALFFAEHLKRYSKSRRAAPIYWPLSTPSCSYTLWLYYHRLSDQILFTCVNDFVDPKLRQVSEETARLRAQKGRSASDEKELERLTDFERELKDFRAELLRVAAFWKPDLNDGVEITASPLWRLFQHKPWQKRLKETWGKLEAGDYDWAHLAYSIWPERVREKCKTDKSLAIAHDLEHLYEERKPPLKKNKGKKQTEMELEDLFDED